jgi:hypothetical protein
MISDVRPFATVSPDPPTGIAQTKSPTRGETEVGEPGTAARASPGAVLVVAGVAALALGVTGFLLQMVGFATDATIVALLCVGSGLAWLVQGRRGQREAEPRHR